MSIADIINGTGAAGNASQTNRIKTKDQLGQKEFLELMIAQLKNQDPFKAMDPSQFLGQLAQFGTVSGIQEMQNAFGTLSSAMRSSQVLDGATMVGREVLVPSDAVTLGAEGAVHGALDVPTGTTALQINIRDASGTLVRRMPLSTSTGMNDFSWDGVADNGTRAPAGQYTIEAVANVAGKPTSLEMLLASRVNSVTIDSASGLTLNTNNLGSRALSDVRRVM
ncbi:MAG TPA: flagellar hook assembly protein FlgD [Steroidobacteraceae bacterium]|nr:flagellar hook assembly protein FlgD [Steroidobacteraceae bacterium]